MGVILESERGTAKAKAFLAVVYSALLLGAATMVYPFAVMLSASLSSGYDYNRHTPVVIGFFDRNDRFVRSIAMRFRTFPREVYPDAPASWTSWAQVAKDRPGVAAFAERELSRVRDGASLARAAADARARLCALAADESAATDCCYDPRDVARFAKRRFGTVERMNAAWPVPHKSFFDVSFSAESKAPPGRADASDAKYAAWLDFKREYLKDAVERGDFGSRTMPLPLSMRPTPHVFSPACSAAARSSRFFFVDFVSTSPSSSANFAACSASSKA